MFKLDSTEGYFIHLMACALNSTQPVEKPDNVSFEEVYRLSNKQLFTNATFMSIDKLKIKPPKELYEKWQAAYAFELAQCANQLFELELLVDSFVSQGYDVMPLKGSIVRNYYPTPDMRTMTDIDLLVKADNREAVRKIMYSCGYEMFLPDDGQVDTFKKGKYGYIDLHYYLMAKNHHGQEHFQDTWDIAYETDRKGVYAFTYEDLYVYNVGHYAKHMFSSGTGMRCVADVYVMWKNATDEQKAVISEKLKQKELYTFNEQLVKVAGIWFDGDEDDGSTDDIQAYFINTSTYGNEDSVDAIKLMTDTGENISKGEYYRKRIFPGAEYLYTRYNIKHRCPLVLPFLWLYRLISVVFIGKKVAKEVTKTENVTQENIDKSRILYSKLGLLNNDDN